MIYLALTFVLVAMLRWIERRALAHLRGPGSRDATPLAPAAPDEAYPA